MIFGPIKDEKVIEQIKEKYRSNGDFQQLLIFLLSINTGLRVNEVLSLKVKDVKNKYYLYIGNQKSIYLLSISINKVKLQLLLKLLSLLTLKIPVYEAIDDTTYVKIG